MNQYKEKIPVILRMRHSSKRFKNTQFLYLFIYLSNNYINMHFNGSLEVNYKIYCKLYNHSDENRCFLVEK